MALVGSKREKQKSIGRSDRKRQWRGVERTAFYCELVELLPCSSITD